MWRLQATTQEKVILDRISNAAHTQNPRLSKDGRGFLRYLVELDRIELTAS